MKIVKHMNHGGRNYVLVFEDHPEIDVDYGRVPAYRELMSIKDARNPFAHVAQGVIDSAREAFGAI